MFIRMPVHIKSSSLWTIDAVLMIEPRLFPRTDHSIEPVHSYQSVAIAQHAAIIQKCPKSDSSSIAVQTAHATGVRARELLTSRRSEHVPVSARRLWSETHLSVCTGVRHTVRGKGGLRREFLIPPWQMNRSSVAWGPDSAYQRLWDCLLDEIQVTTRVVLIQSVQQEKRGAAGLVWGCMDWDTAMHKTGWPNLRD